MGIRVMASVGVFLMLGIGSSFAEELRLRDDASAPTAKLEAYANYPWLGLGLRAGYARTALASRRLPNGANDVSDDVRSTNFMLVPSLHAGGDRLFMRLDVPIAKWQQGYLVGLGFYPLNYGHYLPRLRSFPYISLGGSAAMSYANHQEDLLFYVPVRAVMLQARIAAGWKWRVLPHAAVVLDVGYSPIAVGAILDQRRQLAIETQMQNGRIPDMSEGRRLFNAGVGSVLEVTFGIEWM